MNKLTFVATLGLAAVLILGIAVCNESRADPIPVSNADFETLYKPGTAIEGHVSPGGWSQGVGPDCPIDDGGHEFDDGTSGDVADIPGWIGADRDGWIANGGTYDRDETTGNLQGSVNSQYNFTDGGVQSYLANGGDWGNPAGGLIVSDAPLAVIESNLTYTVSMMANGAAAPVTLDLLADGVALTPSSSVDPVLSAEWQEYSRTYDLASLAGSVGKDVTIQLGVGREASGTQSHFDDASLSSTSSTLLGDVNLDGEVNGLDVDPFVGLVTGGTYQDEGDMNGDGEVNGLDVDPFVAAVVGGGTQQIPEPSTLLLGLLALGVLGGWRKRKRAA
jgi:hypothetical protein